MENKLTYTILLIVLVFIGIYISRELTESQYLRQIKEMKEIKDSITEEIKRIDYNLHKKDLILANYIKHSKDLLEILKRDIPKSLEKINKLEAEIAKNDSILIK